MPSLLRRSGQSLALDLEQKAPPPDEAWAAAPFDFASRSALGRLLLVGEGNLSFARSLAERAKARASIIASTFEAERTLSENARRNATTLRDLGARVLHGVDATRLESCFKRGLRTIMFQFPNSGSRRSVYGGTANYHLMRRFLRSCDRVLASGGVVAITTVDSPYYHGLFDVPGASDAAGFSVLSVHPFRRSRWNGYSHVNTLDVGNALRASYRACTWVLAPRPTSSRRPAMANACRRG